LAPVTISLSANASTHNEFGAAMKGLPTKSALRLQPKSRFCQGAQPSSEFPAHLFFVNVQNAIEISLAGEASIRSCSALAAASECM
jgi:hypothetical protein